jgi:predicted aspartyl protease
MISGLAAGRLGSRVMNRLLALLLLLALGCCSSPSGPRVELASAEWIPFEFLGEQHILLAGAVNGHPADMILDTGAEISVVDRTFADSIDLQQADTLHMKGFGGSTESFLAEGLKLSVGNLSIHQTAVAVADLTDFSVALGQPVPVILGTEAFMQAIVDIDYPNRRIAFRAADNFRYDGPGNTLELKHLKRGRHAVEASIEGGASAWYMIDTGSGFTADVYPQLARRLQLLNDRAPTSKWISGGIGGLVEGTTASVLDFSLGGFDLKDVPVWIPDGTDPKSANADFDGLLGSGILSRFRILFDFGHGRMHLEGGPGWQTRDFSRNRMGLAALPEGEQLLVIFVAPGSPAESAGWQKGMSIATVEGLSGTPGELRAKLRKLSTSAAGTRISLRDQNGTERALVLTRFY